MEIDDFLSWLEVERRGSAHTVEAYGRDLRQFSDWLCADGSPFDAGSVTVSDVRAWMGALASEGLKAVTLRRKVQSVRAFYNWAMKTGRLERNPAADVTLPKKRRKLPEIIREKDMEEVLDADPSGFRAQRAHLVLSMLYSLGLRQAELLGVDGDGSSPTRSPAGRRRATHASPTRPDHTRCSPARMAAYRNRPSTRPCATPLPGCPRADAAPTRSATRSPPPWWATEPTSTPSARCSATHRSPRHRSIHT